MTVLSGPMGGSVPIEAGRMPGCLPFTGGAAEQPACIMDAFAIMEAAAQALKPGSGES